MSSYSQRDLLGSDVASSSAALSVSVAEEVRSVILYGNSFLYEKRLIYIHNIYNC